MFDLQLGGVKYQCWALEGFSDGSRLAHRMGNTRSQEGDDRGGVDPRENIP